MSQLNDQKSYQTQYKQFVSKYPNFIRNVKTDKHIDAKMMDALAHFPSQTSLH